MNDETCLVTAIWHDGNEVNFVVTHVDDKVLVTFDDKVPVTFDDTVPVTFDDKVRVTFDDKVPVTFADKVPVTFDKILAIFDDKVPVTFDDVTVTITDAVVATSGGHDGLTYKAMSTAWTGVFSSLTIVLRHGVCPAFPTRGAADAVLRADFSQAVVVSAPAVCLYLLAGGAAGMLQILVRHCATSRRAHVNHKRFCHPETLLHFQRHSRSRTQQMQTRVGCVLPNIR